MTNSKNTKRALLASVLSVVLCFAMLVGSTFAWFTDSVTSAGNIIKSGTLDVMMEWADGTKSLTDPATKWNDAAQGDIFNSNLWEPGYTEVRHVKISNVGSLALKYEIRIAATGEISELADVIDVYYIKDGKQIADRADLTDADKIGTLADVLANPYAAKGHISGKVGETVSSDIATIALKMQESAGNKYQDMSIGSKFAIQLVATQYTEELDSFDNQYDKGAEYPITVSSSNDLSNAVVSAADGSTIMLNNDVVLNSPLSVSGNITLDLGTSQVTNNTKGKDGISVTGNNKNVTIKATTGGVSMENDHCIKVNTQNSDITVDGGVYSVSGTSNAYFMEDGWSNSGSNHVTIQNVTYNGERGVQFSNSDNNVIDIKDCSFTTTGYSTLFIGGNNNVCNLENVTINGSKIFAADSGHTGTDGYSVINIKSGTYNCSLSTSTNCTISITGGSFSSDPTKYLADGYKATKNSSTNMWDVTANS